MDLGLQNARVLVTAASQGLGAATARRFSLEGAQVVINSRNLEKLQQTAAAINQESGNPVFTLAGDVAEPDTAGRIVQAAAEMLGGLDILVTNAGGPPGGNFDDFDQEDWQQATQLTFLSVVALVRAALPFLRESSRPAVLAIQSMSVKQPIPDLTLSNAVRPAVIGLTKSLSLELGPEGIRVNSILPGMTDTERVAGLMQRRVEQENITLEEARQQAANNIPLRRIGTPEEFANMAVFLCSPAAGFVTGAAVPVDGGATRATL
jgi:3-oxoacyl-[acyl-carrier protein] reductase